ncbi:hypothetical protein KIPB_007838 [Kipferlia bialata]|uniref:Acyltransferase 3 domain-containing protein n=1 Tax=Kipferlia bialata TaxID=797122 RepID=A0A9K3D2E4_9EUKA|nr:hypothetical protein KIPB_007838 [Kipferlia bialata]|eukprot:g7838.t1
MLPPFWSGRWGVCIFFLLSGFVLTHSVRRPVPGRSRLSQYLMFVLRRQIRLMSVFIPLTLYAVWMNALPMPQTGPFLPDGYWTDVCKAIASPYVALAGVSWDPQNGVAWTLGVELRVALIFPLIRFLAASVPRFREKSTTDTVERGEGISSAHPTESGLSVEQERETERERDTNPLWTLQVVSRILWGIVVLYEWLRDHIESIPDIFGSQLNRDVRYSFFFVAGAYIYIHRERITVWVNTWLSTKRVRKSILLAGLLFYTGNATFFDVYPTVICFVLALSLSSWRRVLTHPVLLLLGRLSFCVYMIHSPYFALVKRLTLAEDMPFNNTLSRTLCGPILTSLLYAIPCYHMFERPGTRLLGWMKGRYVSPQPR